MKSKNEPVLNCGTTTKSQKEIAGPKVFKAKCASCHSFHTDLTGPKMNGVLQRVPSEEWLRAFLTNQDSLISIRDEYIMSIMEWSPVEWNHDFNDSDSKRLDTLIGYITQ